MITIAVTDFKAELDAQIRRLQVLRQLTDVPQAFSLLKELANDPDSMLPLIKEFVAKTTSNGNGNGIHVHIQPTLSTAPAWPPAKRSRGDQQRLVEETLASATAPVTTDWIVAKMREAGYQFSAARPNVAVNECLKWALEHGRARINQTS
ncbi:MAG TPA: hypothetical protein VE998_10790, partial [Terriglobales bacterium]|nr:hypothetical protein [Terriglobales bacterium]